MFTLHSIWPFLWIWATIYHADRGYGFSETSGEVQKILERLDIVERRLEAAENNVKEIDAAISAPVEAVPESTPKTIESEEV